MEKIFRSKKSNILWLAYQQGQIFKKFKVNENFLDLVKELGISKSTTLFKISIVKFANKYPRMKKSSLSLHFLKNNFEMIKEICHEIWACPTMGSWVIGSKFKLCQIWSYYILFEPKFCPEQFLREHFIIKINHSSVKGHNVKVIDVIWHYLTSKVNSWYMYLQRSVILNNHNCFVLDLLIMKNELDDASNVMILKCFMWIFQTTF